MRNFIFEGGSIEFLEHYLNELDPPITNEVKTSILSTANEARTEMRAFKSAAYITHLATEGNAATINEYIKKGGSRKALAVAIEQSLKEAIQTKTNSEVDALRKEFAARMETALDAKWAYFQNKDAPPMPLFQRIAFFTSSIFRTRHGNYCRELYILLKDTNDQNKNTLFFVQGGNLEKLKKHAEELKVKNPTPEISEKQKFISDQIKPLQKGQNASPREIATAIFVSKNDQAICRYIQSRKDPKELIDYISSIANNHDTIDISQPDFVAKQSPETSHYNLLKEADRTKCKLEVLHKLESTLVEAEKIRFSNRTPLNTFQEACKNLKSEIEFIEQASNTGWDTSKIALVLQIFDRGSAGWLEYFFKETVNMNAREQLIQYIANYTKVSSALSPDQQREVILVFTNQLRDGLKQPLDQEPPIMNHINQLLQKHHELAVSLRNDPATRIETIQERVKNAPANLPQVSTEEREAFIRSAIERIESKQEKDMQSYDRVILAIYYSSVDDVSEEMTAKHLRICLHIATIIARGEPSSSIERTYLIRQLANESIRTAVLREVPNILEKLQYKARHESKPSAEEKFVLT